MLYALTLFLAIRVVTRVRWFRLVMALTVPKISTFTCADINRVAKLLLTAAFVAVGRVVTTKALFLTSWHHALLIYRVPGASVICTCFLVGKGIATGDLDKVIHRVINNLPACITIAP